MQYRLVYDFLDQPFWFWSDLWLGCGLALFGCIALYLQRYPSVRSVSAKAFAGVAVFFGGLIVLFGFPQNYLRYRFLHREIALGRAALVEGPVQSFVPMPYSGHANEEFCVREACFQYSDFGATRGGFNNTRSHGGPIHDGLQVRLMYVDGSIVRLEIAGSER